MSDYRRFIAYLYEYPKNRKGGCCGFVRVESQNGFCRMDFQIKSASLPPETSITVYGFIRRSGRMYGIPLGNLLSGRTAASGKLFTQSDALGQTSITLDELGGLILLYRQTGIIATQWDDLPIQPEFFSPALPQEPTASADAGSSPLKAETAKAAKIPDFAAPAQPLPSSAAFEIQSDEFSTETSDIPASYPQKSVTKSTIPTESTSAPKQLSSQPEPEPDTQPLHMTSTDSFVPASTAVPPSRAALYLQLQDQFPEFHPFPDDDLTDCLRLSIDDLPQLRAAGLSADANRFVLHGSSSYRHLLLARNRDQQEIWYFGVPGVCTPNEQFMASLFGFFHFKQAMRPAELAPDARFGYWYRTL